MAQFSDLTGAVDALKENVGDLSGAYENDADMVDLKEWAIVIRDRAQTLVGVFDTLNEGLASL